MKKRQSLFVLLTVEERCEIEHFNAQQARNSEGRFVIPLPKRSKETKLGESRSQAVGRFLSFERSTRARGTYFKQQQHAEAIPQEDLEKPQDEVFYLPIHVVLKESILTTKVRAIFDASAATSTSGSRLKKQILLDW